MRQGFVLDTELSAYVRRCKVRTCGAVVESRLSPVAQATRFVEVIVCPKCGADNSPKPSLWQRWRFGRKKFKRHWHIYKLRALWYPAPWKHWLTPAEGGKW